METVTYTMLSGLLFILYAGTLEAYDCHMSQGNCCIMCNPGYFLTGKCGTCKPCPIKGYMDRPNKLPYCEPCRRCQGIFRYKETCNSTRNSICECIPGKRCADAKCMQCENNPCPAGQQLDGEKCMNCPHGTFNPGTEGTCKPWKNCSALGAVILVNGTHASDVVCGNHIVRATARPTTSSTVTSITNKPEDPASENKEVFTVVIVIVSIMFVLFLIGFFIFLRKVLEKMKNNFKKIPNPVVKQTEQEDACSCHFPEEEHGGEDEPMTRAA